MKIVIIGTGNTASVLGKKLKQAGHDIVQVFGRDASAASKLAYELDTDSTNYWSVIKQDADVYLIAVSDEAINEITTHLRLPEKVVAHTAGSVKHDVLSKTTEHYGVFYPLQSLHKNIEQLPELSIIIEASDDHTRKVLEQLAASITSQKALMNDEDRMKFHIAAVICNNFTNYLYALAEEYCQKENLDFTLLYPLIQETAQRILQIPPSKSQTGPALRRDESTIQEHLRLLDDHYELKKVYEFLTQSINSHRFQ